MLVSSILRSHEILTAYGLLNGADGENLKTEPNDPEPRYDTRFIKSGDSLTLEAVSIRLVFV